MTEVNKDGTVKCHYCDHEDIPEMEHRGPHVKLSCSNCCRYLKFGSKQEVHWVMEALTKETKDGETEKKI